MKTETTPFEQRVVDNNINRVNELINAYSQRDPSFFESIPIGHPDVWKEVSRNIGLM